MSSRSVRVSSSAAAVLRSAGCGIVVLDGAGVVQSANPEAVRLLGWTEDQVRGLSVFDTFYRDGATAAPASTRAVGSAGSHLLDAARGGHRVTRDADVFVRHDGSLLTVRWSADPLVVEHDTGDGVVRHHPADVSAGVVLTLAEVTDQQDRVGLWRSQRTEQDLGWISELTRVMSTTLDEVDALRRLARLLVPRLGDVVVVDQIDDHGVMHRLGGAVATGLDVDLDAVLARPEVAHHGAGDPTTRSTIDTAVVQRLTAGQLGSPEVLGEPSRLLLAAIGATSMLIVPLGTRGDLVAVAGVIRVGDVPFDDQEMLLAADIGRRAGLVLDNARLYSRAVRAAADLQMALLPAVNDSDHVTAAARYLPARDRYRVGGDWYDLFVCPATGATIMIIGDVVGHDLAAATLMAALRNLLRGAAIAAGAGPAATLATVDHGMAPLGVTGTATAAVFAADRTAEGWTLTWASAGHPPALVVEPGGTTRLLDGRADPLLGTRTDPVRHDHHLDVPHGTTVLLYTDGLVEQRHEDIDHGLTRLRRTAGARPVDDPDQLLQLLVDRMPHSPDDDTAMLAVRLD